MPTGHAYRPYPRVKNRRCPSGARLRARHATPREHGYHPAGLGRHCVDLWGNAARRSSVAAEFRVVISGPPGGREPRGSEDVLCIAIGQHSDTVASLGLGNPHVKTAEAGYRHCKLPRTGLQTLWIVCDPVSGWVALGRMICVTSRS